MRKRSLTPADAADCRMHKFQRPQLVPTLSLVVHSAKFGLNVLICRPEFGSHHHWALQLDNLSTGDGTIFEVQGAFPALEYSSYQCRRLYYPLPVLKTVRVREFDLSMSGYGAMSHAIEHQVPVRNDVLHWNCQDYVLAILDMLEEEWWIDADDEDYMQVRRRLKAMYGPVELVQKAVVAAAAAAAKSGPGSPISDTLSKADKDDRMEVEPKKVPPAKPVLVSDNDG